MRRSLPPLLLILSACTSFQGGRPLDQVPLPAQTRARYEVWSHGEGHQLHALRIENDSVVGVPWWKDPACDSCRVAIARGEVDSVRTLKFDGNQSGALASLAIPFIAFPALGLALMYILGFGPSD
jgi:hypothetical protein